jgi:5S rRNA maturation endonuclease (ribonuclease M5)
MGFLFLGLTNKKMDKNFKDFLQELMDAIDIESYYIQALGEPVKRTKTHITCFCVFHSDGANPNLVIALVDGKYKEASYFCSSCLARGSLLDFHMHQNHMTAYEAFCDLARTWAPDILEEFSPKKTTHKQPSPPLDPDRVREILDMAKKCIEEKYPPYKGMCLENIFLHPPCLLRNGSKLWVCQVRYETIKGNSQGKKKKTQIFISFQEDEVTTGFIKSYSKRVFFTSGGKLPVYLGVSLQTPNPDAIHTKDIVFLTEGYKQAVQLTQLGIKAITTGSVNSLNGIDLTILPKNLIIIIWSDNDKPGKKYASDIAKKLKEYGHEICFIDVEILGLPSKGDVSDYLVRNPQTTAIDILSLKRLNELPGQDIIEMAVIEWGETIPLRRKTPPTSEFPVDALGPTIGDAAKKLHEIVQSPLGLCCQSMLASVTLIVQSRADISIDGRIHPISNFYLTIAKSGERKSATDDIALRPISLQQDKLIKEHIELQEDYRVKHATWKREFEIINRVKSSQEERAKAFSMLGPEPESPIHPLLKISEPTLEGLVKYMKSGQPSIGMFTDEGGQFIGGYSMNNDNRLKTISGFSRLWDGKPIDVCRSGDGWFIINGRRFSMHLLMQPEVSDLLFGSSIVEDQGFLSRCLVSYPPSTIGDRLYNQKNLLETEELKSFFDQSSAILNDPPRMKEGKRNELDPSLVILSPEGKLKFIKFHDLIEVQMKTGEPLQSITGFASKVPEHASRIAGILSSFYNPTDESLGDEWMKNGIIIAEHYIEERLRQKSSAQVSPQIIKAELLYEWMQTQPDPIYPTKIYQFGPHAIRDKATAEQLCKILLEHQLIRIIPGGARIDGSHRKIVYQVYRPKKDGMV